MAGSISLLELDDFIKNTYNVWKSEKLDKKNNIRAILTSKNSYEEFKILMYQNLQLLNNYPMVRGEYLVNYVYTSSFLLTNYRLIIRDLEDIYHIIPLNMIKNYKEKGFRNPKAIIKLKDNSIKEIILRNSVFPLELQRILFLKEWEHLSDFELEILSLTNKELEKKIWVKISKWRNDGYDVSEMEQMFKVVKKR
jgi:hypothetical protein